MAKAHYIGVSGVARKVKKSYIGVDGVARGGKSGYVGVSGVARQFLGSDNCASNYAVGDSVFLPISTTNGIKNTEFVVIHQGNPNRALYAENCTGTWVMLKYYTVFKTQPNAPTPQKAWDSTDNDYANSDIHGFLNGEYYTAFSSNVRNAIKEVNIPYYYGNGGATNGEVRTGSNGLSTKIFLLSNDECNVTAATATDYAQGLGSCLDYFAGFAEGSDRHLFRRSENTATINPWQLRTPWTKKGVNVTSVTISFIRNNGVQGGENCTTSDYIRPAFILDSSASFDPETNILL